MTDEELESALQYQYDIGYDEGYQAARDEMEDEMEQWHRITSLPVQQEVKCESCGTCQHFECAPHWHDKPFQGEADGICLAAWTRGKLEWVTEDETACQDWER